MASHRSITRKHFRLKSPDYSEERQGNWLLVWKDIPHWMVVDEDLHSFLGMLNGKEALGTIFAGNPQLSSYKQEITGVLDIMLERSVLEDIESNTATGTREKDKAVPIENVALNITRQCNLRCRFCYNREYLIKSGEGELTEDEIMSILTTVRPLASRQCSLTILGGEPLTYPEKLLAISDCAAKHGFPVLVSTNGTLVTKGFARRAKKTGLEMQVSIDGHTAELNDGIRGKGTFDRIVQGIHTLVDNGAYTIISMVCHESNLQYLEDFYEFALSLGVNEARFIPLKLMGGAIDGSFRPVTMKELILKAFDLFRKNTGYIKLAGRDAFNIIANTCRYSARRTSCGTGLQTFLLDSEGTIYPCLNCNMPEFKIANIRDDGFDFVRVWNESSKLKEHRVLTSVESRRNACSKCLVRYWCLGVCRGETYLNRGALNKRAYNCRDSKAAIIEMMWLLSEDAVAFAAGSLVHAPDG